MSLKIYSWMLLLPMLFSSSLAIAETTKPGMVVGGKMSQHPSWFKESFLEIASDVEEAADENKHVMLFLYLNGCPYCYKMVEENIANSRYTNFIQQNFDVIALNIQGDREVALNEETTMTEKEYAEQLQIRFTPTILFLNQDNKVVVRVNGYRSVDAFEHVLHYVQQKSYNDMTLAQFIEQQQKPVRYTFRDHPQLQTATDLQQLGQQPLALLFEDSWCDACDALHDGVLKDPQTQAILQNMAFVRLDANADTPIIAVDGSKTTAKAYTQQLGLTYRPGIVLFDKGTEIRRIDGMLYSFHFQENLRYVAERGYEQFPTDFYEYLAKRTQEILASGRDIDVSK